MQSIVVTSGEQYVDIDAVASAIAYTELLGLTGNQATVVFPGILNQSVTPSIRALGLRYQSECPTETNGFVIVDTSNPEAFAKCVDIDRVREIYDHHSGFENFWKERLNNDCHIEAIGAAATLIWEAFVRAGKDCKISRTSARLLSYAIVSNSLNLRLPITSDRDRSALCELLSHADLPDGWIESYFKEVEQSVTADLRSAITNDTKLDRIRGIHEPIAFGQLELWDPSELLRTRKPEIRSVLSAINDRWMMNLPSLHNGHTTFVTPDTQLQSLLTTALGIEFHGDTAVANVLYLRKTFIPLIEMVADSFPNA